MTSRNQRRRASNWLVATVAIVATPVVALADTKPSYEDLQKRIELLESRVQATEEQKRADAAAARQVDATIDAVARDANKRSQMLAEGGLTAGYDKGFFIKSEDGNFLFKPSAIFQFRGVSNTNDSGSDDETVAGFEIRRARFRFDGHVVTPDLTYSFVWDTNRQGGAVTLLDAWAAYKITPEISVKVGQFKESWSHEKDISFTNQLAVDRTLVDTVIGGNLTDRVQGVSVTYGGTKNNPIRAEVALHDGANSKNTDFRDFVGTTANPANFGAGGRFEYKLFGDWANYRDFTAKGNKEDLLVVGGGLDWTQRGDLDTTIAGIDAQYETAWGLNAFAGIVGNFANTGAGNRSDYGVFGQVGYLVAPAWEVFGRYDVLLLDDNFTDDDTFNEITVGVNYFLGKDGSALHRAKITVDATFLPDGAPSTQTGIGVLAGNDQQFVFRAQFQLQL
ncbi:porin [Humisphaera borealis]|uniref:Porin n=1 Tax=Humisphaera borealis TaxID=2807512 RepID=A0A7M2WSE4_9BACT|nr:porin [Humisphaera borealis]QOV88428.1 hypothetical protein IPV69_19560 [Humisphaera borealis]